MAGSLRSGRLDYGNFRDRLLIRTNGGSKPVHTFVRSFLHFQHPQRLMVLAMSSRSDRHVCSSGKEDEMADMSVPEEGECARP